MTTEELRQYFTDILESGRIPHAFIMEGDPEHYLPVLEDFLEKLLEEGPRNHPDVVRVVHEKPGFISVEEIRRQLVEDMGIRPYRSMHKIYLVSDAELMRAEAQNALLKTLEEPPAYGMIFLLTASAESLLSTIRSRATILQISGGGAGSLSAEDRQILLQILRDAPEYGPAQVNDAVKQLMEIGARVPYSAVLELCRLWYRDVLVSAVTGGQGKHLLSTEQNDTDRAAAGISMRRIDEVLDEIARAEIRIKANVNTEMVLKHLLNDMGGR